MPIITISRASHSGGTQVAERLHELLGYPLMGDQVVTETARRYGVSEEELLRGLDMPANFFERFTSRRQRYLLATQATLGEVFQGGDGIYHGFAGQFVFAGTCNVFKVRLAAPMEDRVRSAMTLHGFSREQAVSHLNDVDQRRAKWSRQMFGVDWNEPSLYDLMVNLGQMTVDAAARMIAETLGREDARPTDACLEEFRNFVLERRVVAELYFKSPFNADIVRVRANRGQVLLSGGSAFEGSKRAVVEFVAQVVGAENVVVESDDPVSHGTQDLEIGMSSRDTTARDVMLPPERYPRIPQWATIREAMVALTASAVRFEDGHITMPRYLLVLDEDDQLVGIVSRRELVRGLLPQLREAERSRAQIRKLVGFGGETPAEISIRWTSLFTRTAVEAAKDPVSTVMTPVRGSVRLEDSLSTVITTMLHHGIDLVPVLDGRRVAGVVLMTNIFDIVAQFILEQGGRGR
jgi:cytidylate kinase